MSSPEQVSLGESQTVIRQDVMTMLLDAQERANEEDRLPEASVERVVGWLSSAQDGWDKYGPHMDRPEEVRGGPAAVQELLSHPNAMKQLGYLDQAYQRIAESEVELWGMTQSTITPEGVPLARTMGLVLIPWKSLQEGYTSYYADAPVTWVERCRRQQGLAVDTQYNAMASGLATGGIQYRDPRSDTVEWIDAMAYLQERVQETTTETGQGGWGVALMQMGSDTGIRGDHWQQFDYAEDPEGSEAGIAEHTMSPMAIAGARLDGVDITSAGVFELLAHSLQVDDPREQFGMVQTRRSQVAISQFALANFAPNLFLELPQIPYVTLADGAIRWGMDAANKHELRMDNSFRACVI